MIDDDADFPLTQEAEDFLAIIERRIEQGLAHHPFPDGAWSGFIKLNEDGTPYNPSYDEILRLVSGWFVKKDNKFHDVNNLQTTYQAQDLKQVIVSRIKVLFPKLELTNKDLKEFFLVLLDPPISERQSRKKHPSMVRAYRKLACEYPEDFLQRWCRNCKSVGVPSVPSHKERKRDRLRCFPCLCHSKRSRACCVPELACLVPEARRTEASLGCDAVQPETRYW